MEVKDYKLNHQQERIVNMLDKGIATASQIGAALGKGYTELKVRSMVLTLARKGLVDKTKAALILQGTPMIRFLNIPFGAHKKN